MANNQVNLSRGTLAEAAELLGEAWSTVKYRWLAGDKTTTELVNQIEARKQQAEKNKLAEAQSKLAKQAA